MLVLSLNLTQVKRVHMVGLLWLPLLLGCTGDGGVKESAPGANARESAIVARPENLGSESRVQLNSWSDISGAGIREYESAKAAHDAGLSSEQRDAWHLTQAVQLGNPFAVGIMQKAMIDTAIRNRYIALRRGSAQLPPASPESITHQLILDGLLCWPLMEQTKAPWRLCWQGQCAGEVPRVELAEGALPLFGSQAYSWEFGVSCAFPQATLQTYGPEASIEPDALYPNHDAELASIQSAFGVLDLYIQQLGLPELPELAFQAVPFGVNQTAEQAILKAHGRESLQFVLRQDQAAYGLLLVENTGQKHLIFRELGSTTGVRRLGLHQVHQAEIDRLLSGFKVWQSLAAMAVPRLKLEVPSREVPHEQTQS